MVRHNCQARRLDQSWDPVRAGKTRGRVIRITYICKADRSDVEMFGAQAPNNFTLNVLVEGRNANGSAKTNSRSGAKIYEVQAVANSTIVGNTVTPGATLNTAPVAGSPFSIGYTDVSLSLWRVLSVVEKESTYEITAIAHEQDKYSVIEKAVSFVPRDVTQLAEKPDPVANLQLQKSSMRRLTKCCNTSPLTGNSRHAQMSMKSGSL